MRILVVQESDWLKKGPHQSHHLMERLSLKGHEVRVVDFEILWRKYRDCRIVSTREVHEYVHKATERGDVTVIRPPIVRLPILDYISLVFSHRREIRYQIEAFKPDVFVAFGILNAFISLRLARRNEIPFVYYIIDELHRFVPTRWLQGFAKLIESSNVRRADIVISINEALREYTIEMGAERGNTRVLRAGVDIERFTADSEELRNDLRNSLGISRQDTLLFYMGWLYDFSGLKEVIRQLADEKWKSNAVKLLVIGEGDLWDWIQRFRIEHGLEDRVILECWKPYSEIPKFVNASDICLLPAHKNKIMHNIVPIKMYEYLAAGRPVIATRLAGLEIEFGENNGVVYVDKPEDTVELAVRLSHTDNLETMGRAARHFVKDSDWETVTKVFENQLMEVRL